jgi:hypothetical protein
MLLEGSAGSIISIGTLRVILCDGDASHLGMCMSLDREIEGAGGSEIGSR